MKRFLSIVLVLCLASAMTFAQGFKLVGAGGFVDINGLLGPSGATDAVSQGGAGMGFGPHFGIGGQLKATMGSNDKLKWVGALSYDIFEGSGGSPNITITQGLFRIGLGADYSLKAMNMGSKQVWPYVGGEVQINVFPGASLSPEPTGYVAPDTKTRIGLGLRGGAEYPINQKMNLDVALKLSFDNLIGTASNPKDGLYASSTTGSYSEGLFLTLGLTLGLNFSLGGGM